MTLSNTGEASFPGTGRPVISRIQKSAMTPAVRMDTCPPGEAGRTGQRDNNAYEETGEVSFVPVAGYRHPSGVRIGCEPRTLPERIRKKLTRSARAFLRRCGEPMSRPGSGQQDQKNDLRPEEREGESPIARLSSRFQRERAS